MRVTEIEVGNAKQYGFYSLPEWISFYVCIAFRHSPASPLRVLSLQRARGYSCLQWFWHLIHRESRTATWAVTCLCKLMPLNFDCGRACQWLRCLCNGIIWQLFGCLFRLPWNFVWDSNKANAKHHSFMIISPEVCISQKADHAIPALLLRSLIMLPLSDCGVVPITLAERRQQCHHDRKTHSVANRSACAEYSVVDTRSRTRANNRFPGAWCTIDCQVWRLDLWCCRFTCHDI